MTLIEDRLGQPDVDAPEPEVCVEPAVAVATPAAGVDIAAPSRRRLVAGLEGPLAGRWVPVLAIAWVTIFSLGVALEPEPTGEEAFPLVGMALALAVMSCWGVMASGLIQRRHYGALASAAGAVCLVGMTIACPVSGHHAGLGGWWWFQLAGSLTLLGLSRAALASR